MEVSVWLKTVSVLGVLVVCVALGGCKDDAGDDNNGNNSINNISLGEGLCRESCPKLCDSDNDCDTASGMMCCDFGGGAMTCTQPENCPRFCSNDSECNSDMGEACCMTNLSSSDMVCSKPQNCMNVCSGDADCADDEICCTKYKTPICVSPNQCPQECGSSTDCQSEKGEICCKSISEYQEILDMSGICYSKGMSCARDCASTTDCNTQDGEICCNGVCSTSCTKSCKENADCDMSSGQMCCTNPVISTVWWTGKTSLFSYTSGEDYCCRSSNPCNWDSDGICDCGGEYAYSWDQDDCGNSWGVDAVWGVDAGSY